MATKTETPDYQEAAERLVAKLPKAVRDKTTIESGGGKYALVKYGGRTVASVRSKNVRVTFGHSGSADSLGELAGAVAEAAKSRPEVKAKKKAEQGDE